MGSPAFGTDAYKTKLAAARLRRQVARKAVLAKQPAVAKLLVAARATARAELQRERARRVDAEQQLTQVQLRQNAAVLRLGELYKELDAVKAKRDELSRARFDHLWWQDEVAKAAKDATRMARQLRAERGKWARLRHHAMPPVVAAAEAAAKKPLPRPSNFLGWG